MAYRLSRRSLARHSAEQLLAGVSQKTVLEQVAAYLIESHRIKELELIVQDIIAYLAKQGTVVANITSAFDLSDATNTALKQFIAEKTGATDITLTETIDPSVLGGVKVELPGQELDTTIIRKLTHLRAK